MWEPAPGGIFTYKRRDPARQTGEDRAVFSLFHPGLDPDTDDIPGVDMDGMYYLISSTLMYEFLLETLPQIVIQAINNTEEDSWSTFTYVSIGISGFVAVDAL